MPGMVTLYRPNATRSYREKRQYTRGRGTTKKIMRATMTSILRPLPPQPYRPPPHPSPASTNASTRTRNISHPVPVQAPPPALPLRLPSPLVREGHSSHPVPVRASNPAPLSLRPTPPHVRETRATYLSPCPRPSIQPPPPSCL